MDIRKRVNQMDAMVARGGIVDAVKEFFAENATTSDYEGVKTRDKVSMIEKMEAFTGGIEKVNAITLHNSIVDGQLSASEFTFNFDMKDGSNIYWHEIIRRDWNSSGEVTGEEYFKA